MSTHQVITGALNKGENVYAIGSVEGTTFTACAVGSDVVILAADFSRVQVIPGCSHQTEQLVSSVSCCQDSGKIAATYGDNIRIFEPTVTHADRSKQIHQYQWVETQFFSVNGSISTILWNMDGLRLMVVLQDELILYQHRSVGIGTRVGSTAPVMFCIAEEDQKNETCSWDVVWSERLAQPPKYIKFSPDGSFLATAGENDLLVKIFYQEPIEIDRDALQFSFISLHHPAAVRGLEWRRTGRYMPRKCIQAVLMTWCEDNTSRIWKETPPPELSIIDITGDGGEPAWEQMKPRKFFAKHFRVKKTRNKIMNKLKGIIPEKKRRFDDAGTGLGLRAQIGKTSSFSDLQLMNQNSVTVQFHLAAAINADNDCLLVPSMENGSVQQKPFCVHWLNNKELVFSIGAEKLLAEALLAENETANRRSVVSNLSPADATEHEESPSSAHPAIQTEKSEKTERPLSAYGSVCSESPSSKDILDVKLEILLRQWGKSIDVLFTIHPVDGSLLTWTVEWLDDFHRQPVVSFSSRFPAAFPITDASSLHPTLNTFNPHEPMYVDVLRGEADGRDYENDRLLERRISNTIHVLTNHENGSLNLWHMAVDESSHFTTILNITHISRMCGHRFQINQIVAHPVLPLLLTTSQFKAENLVEMPEALSEVILWKISPVGPLCKSGGLMELARVTSPAKKAFECLSWIPAILPSCTLGTVCNSPSSCFVARDGLNLVIYQAVIDARGLLAEIFNSTRAQNLRAEDSISLSPLHNNRPQSTLADQFNVVSTQSTAKPGCVLELGQIENAIPTKNKMLLLHVYNERLVVEDDEDGGEDRISKLGIVVDRSKTAVFNDRYFVVMVEQGEEYDSFLMFSLLLGSQKPQPVHSYDDEDSSDDRGFLRPASPLTHSVAKLSFDIEQVCYQRFPLPSGVRVVSAEPAAGHLSSSSLYPACTAPYVLLTSCSDDIVRFWRCTVSPDSEYGKYEWTEWNMISDNRPSELEMEGAILSVSAAHSGRIACAYDPRSGSDLLTAHSPDVEIGVFECESSGGVEWLREDTLSITNIAIPPASRTPVFCHSPHSATTLEFFTSPRLPSEDLRRAVDLLRNTEKPKCAECPIGSMVRLDWVSTEDGAHILTAGVAQNIYLYTQISHDPAQQNVVLMKESETTLRRPSLRKMSSLIGNNQSNKVRLTRWVCTRVLELHSADGLPPIPTTISWARDGLLIVGLQSEMRVYNQWNLKPENKDNLIKRKATNAQPLTLTISQSHSMLDQLQKKKDLPNSKSKMFLDIVNKNLNREADPQSVLEALSGEGLFEAARLASPILPQYHPKQLIVLLNAGKTRRVKAILLHVLRALKQKEVAVANPLSRAASIRRMSTVDATDMDMEKNVTRTINIEEDALDYDEIDDIPPLALHALMAADNETIETGENAAAFGGETTNGYDSLFNAEEMNDNDLDTMLKDSDSIGGRSRHPSGCSELGTQKEAAAAVIFTAKHNRMLTELLTHTHLPGLSSVDQMHLLAIADTLSHFSSDVMDKLTQANAAMQPVVQSVLGDSTAGGYATAAAGIETVDECGLRYLMAMKQHEYLLVCLPMKQRMELKKKGLSSAHIIWAQHSETETELLNAVPGMQKANSTWDELRSLGAAWWLKNTTSLKICVEKLAKAAFQQNQDPMDASLFYLALKKKNVMTHLFKTVRNQPMAEFFMNDFNEEHWRKVAAKNAFVLMSKQRFQHAAAFFLLSGSLKDALQTILHKCCDLQLAMVVLRLYESDIDIQQSILKEMLCREVLGQSPNEFESMRGKTDDDVCLSKDSSHDPFERSMAYWLLKDYSRAAYTLVEEAHGARVSQDTNLSDIFNFYCYLRKHPLVVRQRLTDAGAQVGSTEKFLAVGKQLETFVTPPERRLFFRTAAEHMAHGCPMLSLDVLTRLPKNISMVKDGTESLKTLLNQTDAHAAAPSQIVETVDSMDWSQPTNVIEKDELQLDWGDDEIEDEELGEANKSTELAVMRVEDKSLTQPQNTGGNELFGSVDIIAQHLKFVASLRIMTEELATLASGFEVDGGQLRYQLFMWLEKEVDMVKNLCDYRTNKDDEDDDSDDSYVEQLEIEGGGNSLHEVLRVDRAELQAKMKVARRRRKWLIANQKLLRSFTSFCALHSAQNHRLTSALMELLLLLLEVQKDSGLSQLNEMVPDSNSFPLLEASVSSTKMFVSSPLSFIENQCYDLLNTIADIHHVPHTDKSLHKTYMLYNLSQGLSSCLYQSLCDGDQFQTPVLARADSKPGILMRRSRMSTGAEELTVSTLPEKWPGVENLVALLGREKEEDAPQLRLLLAESFVAITMSLFCFALAAYDSRWLYRIASHEMTTQQFALIFGGGGEKKLKPIPPARPPRPSTERVRRASDVNSVTGSPPNDANSIRSKYHSKVLGDQLHGSNSSLNKQTAPKEQTIMKWVPPHKNIVQLFAEKPLIKADGQEVDYDSDQESVEIKQDEDEDEKCEQANVNSYAWQLLRLALIEQQSYRIREFLKQTGFEPEDIPANAPRIEAVLRLLVGWGLQTKQALRDYPGGCPVDLIPLMTIDHSDGHLATVQRKYSALWEKGNTPFESEDPRAKPVKRLWSYMIRQEHLQNIFIAHIFSGQGQQEAPSNEKNDTLAGIGNQPIPDAFKIIQKENEPIVAFACNQEKPGWVVVSTGRELQEMDITDIFEETSNASSWLYNRTDLDVHLLNARRDPLKDNDDYQLFSEGNTNVGHAKQAVMQMTPWIIDRSRVGLVKKFKRTVSGIRRIDSHPTDPFYVTGSSDGSIRVWKWEVGQPVYTARVAGQHAKVSKISFSCNGNKFAAVDGDGMLCLWQASHSTEHRKPFFSMRCHNKSASDVRFLGHSSSVLVTAGCSTGDFNLALWDTLLPQNKALVHSWVAHPEGASVAMYLPNQQTIVTGGKHGEICFWDVRQRQLRISLKNAFEPHQTVKTLVTDYTQDLIVAGSSEGDIKIWSADSNPQLMFALPGEHATKGGFSFRQVAQSSVQGVQQLYIDQQMRLFSCGADASLKFRTLPSVYNMTHLV